MSGTGPKTLGFVTLALGALGLVAAMLLAAVAYLDESDNQDRNPGLLNPDPVDGPRSDRNDHLWELAGWNARVGGLALAFGAALCVVGGALNRAPAPSASRP